MSRWLLVERTHTLLHGMARESSCRGGGACLNHLKLSDPVKCNRICIAHAPIGALSVLEYSFLADVQLLNLCVRDDFKCMIYWTRQ